MLLSASSPRRSSSSESKKTTPMPLPFWRLTSIIIPFAPSSPGGRFPDSTSLRTRLIASSAFAGSPSNVATRAYTGAPFRSSLSRAYACVRAQALAAAAHELARLVGEPRPRAARVGRNGNPFLHDPAAAGIERRSFSRGDELVDAVPRELHDKVSARNHREDPPVHFQGPPAEL